MIGRREPEASLALVTNGVSLAPIIVYKGAPPWTRRAAGELAVYIEKVSGARPKVLEGCPDPLPDHAIWVGYQPALDALFPAVDFKFQHPEEIMIAANDRHLVIAGRDRWDPEHWTYTLLNQRTGQKLADIDVQMEYGTANAVYTFLQKYLDMRWLWPGALGEDIMPHKTITFAPFIYRYHPQIRQRDLFLYSVLRQRPALSSDWARVQRLQLGSLYMEAGGHAFGEWVDRFYETHPEYFALQPDGSRHSWGAGKGAAKLCDSNPAVWEQWLKDSEDRLRRDPTLTTLIASPNDGHSSWICVCDKCRAWDSPAGAPWRYNWKGVQREYVAMTDRYVTFWNHLARKLKERFPGRDLRVVASMYGPSTPLPVKAKPDDNILWAYVGNFPGNIPEKRRQQKQEWKAWSKIVPAMIYRPNLWYFAGGNYGLPEISLNKTIEDYRFLAENHCVGLIIDGAGETWATMGPEYYLMAQLAWDPFQDAAALMADYYRRGFGPAAGAIERYWALMESAHEAVVAQPEFSATDDRFTHILNIFPRVYNASFLAQADALLRQAAECAAAKPGVYAQRVAFVRAGFDFTRLMIETIPVMTRVRESGGKDVDAVKQSLANWKAIERIEETTGPVALNLNLIRRRIVIQNVFYRGGVSDYFGPPSDAFQQAAGLMPGATNAVPAAVPKQPAPVAIKAKAAKDGWRLAFSDDFRRDQLSNDWRVIDGKWSVADGRLAGQGTLVLNRAFPGFQRLEFEAATDAGVLKLFGEEKPADVSDLSAFIQARPDDKPADSGYFFQFGAQWNTRHKLIKAGQTVRTDEAPSVRIVPNRRHRIVVENDEGRLRLTVDDLVVLEAKEDTSFVGPGHDRAGLYFYAPARVFNVKLFVKPLKDDTI